MYIPEITEVKERFERLKKMGLLTDWELPYENLLTRRSAAIFFASPTTVENEAKIWNELHEYDHFAFRLNDERKLSQLKYRITFNKEEKDKGNSK